MSNEDKMREEQAIWESVDGDMAAHANTITYHEEAYKAGIKACAAIKDAEIASRDLMIEKVVARLETLCEVIDEPPERNCSCHISPPCSDCVEYGGLREALADAREALANSEHHNSKMLEKMLLEVRIECLVSIKKSMIEAFDIGAIEGQIKILQDALAELNKE